MLHPPNSRRPQAPGIQHLPLQPSQPGHGDCRLLARTQPQPQPVTALVSPGRAASLFSLLRGQCHDSFSSSLAQACGLLPPVTVARRAAFSQHGRLVLVRLVLYILVSRPPAHLQPLLREPRRLDLDADVGNLHDISHLHGRLGRAAGLAAASGPGAPRLFCHNVRSASRQACVPLQVQLLTICASVSSAIESSSKTLPKNGLCIWDPGKWWGLSSGGSAGSAATKASCSNTFVSASFTSLPAPTCQVLYKYLRPSSSVIAIGSYNYLPTISNNYYITMLATYLPTYHSFMSSLLALLLFSLFSLAITAVVHVYSPLLSSWLTMVSIY